MIKIGEKIKSTRKAKKISIKDMSSKCDVEISIISGIEKGRFEPSLKLLVRIAEVLNVNVNELLGIKQLNNIRIEIPMVNKNLMIVSKGQKVSLSYITDEDISFEVNTLTDDITIITDQLNLTS